MPSARTAGLDGPFGPAQTDAMIQRITAAEAKRRMDEEGYLYLDVRSIPEFEQGHPTGAYNIPLMHQSASGAMEPNPDFLRVVNATFDRDQPLVIGCRTGVRSLRAAEMLEAAGWKHVVDQRAGWEGPRDAFGQIAEEGWSRLGLPASTEAEPGRGYEELSR